MHDAPEQQEEQQDDAVRAVSIEAIDVLVHEANRTRTEYAVAAAGLKARIEAFEAAVKEHRADVARLKAAVERDEDALRAATLTHYRRFGEKMPVGKNAVVKARVKLEYDAAKAFAWAKERQLCLVPEQLDAKAFEALVKSGAAKLDFVVEKEVLDVALASEFKLAGVVDAGEVADAAD